VKRRMQIIRLVSLKADSFYEDTQELARQGQKALEEMGKSQLKNLKGVADYALKVSDVLNYIKQQGARHSGWRKDNFADKLITKIEGKVRKDMEETCSQLTSPPASELEKQEIYLMLIREYMKQFTTHYFYSSSGVTGNGS